MGTEIEDKDMQMLMQKIGEEKFQQISQQSTFISSQFKKRRKKVREKLLQPPTPTKDELDQLDQEVEENLKTKILIQDDFKIKGQYEGLSLFNKYKQKLFVAAIHPQSGGMTYWYFILMFALLYNAYVIPLRVCFTPYQTKESFNSHKSEPELFYILNLSKGAVKRESNK